MNRIKGFFEKVKQRERGAVVAEATIALTAFVFAIYLILSIVDICYVQAKMGIALNSAAKEMSQYAYLYDAFGLDEHMAGTGEGKSGELMESFSVVLDKISKGTSNFSQDISQMFAAGSAQAGNDTAAEYIKNFVGMGLAKQLVKKNLKSYEGEDPDAFLKKCHVKDGLDGLNFINTTFLTNVDQNEISVIVSYEVEVVRLLDTRYTFNFVQRAETKAWGKGVSLKEGGTVTSARSIWDASNLSRGNSIITSEKKKYSYTSSSYNFHAYDSQKNQFIRITSLDTFAKSYAGDPSAIEAALKNSYSNLQSGVSKLGEDVPVVNSTGKDATVKSDPATRTYKVVLVVPDSADMTTVNTAVSNFKTANPGVEVEVKSGYGDPAAASQTQTETDTSTDEAA